MTFCTCAIGGRDFYTDLFFIHTQGEIFMTENQLQENDTKPSIHLNEDWLAVLIAAFLILLSVIGVLGENGLMIRF
jgi:hypothetical protein